MILELKKNETFASVSANSHMVTQSVNCSYLQLQDPGLAISTHIRQISEMFSVKRGCAPYPKVFAKCLPSGHQVVTKWLPSGCQVISKLLPATDAHATDRQQPEIEDNKPV